jgi:serine/threonine protein phosphatase PrpC
MGMITPEQAKTDSRRNVLLQCIGASNVVNPDFFYGETLCNAVYMLCTDGFRHEIAPEEIFANFHPDILRDVNTMKINADYLIDLNKQRQERDNISVVLVRTF